MMTPRTIGWGAAASAQLALAAIISITLATNTKTDLTYTSSSQKTRVIVAAPSKEDLVAEEEAKRFNKAMGALGARDAALYRAIFEAQKEGDLSKADRFLLRVSDKRLVGSVMADRFERQGATAEQLVDWLKVFAAQPEASALYAKAIKAGAKKPPVPETLDVWASGNDRDSAANFSPELMVASTAPLSETKKWAQKIQKALRKGDPSGARDVLLAAQKDNQLVGTFAADAEAVIADAFFRSGERQQAEALSSAAAGANQPLGLWIRGLLAWEQEDYGTARSTFVRLADHPALSATNKAAAHFWAYRAEDHLGNPDEGLKHLHEAASAPRSFYGLLATQLLGRSPSIGLSEESTPEWGPQYQTLLAGQSSGWRALALIQVGQFARAEAELQRFNPLGSRSKQRALLALANYVPMPALALRVASLSTVEGFDPVAYPLLPWKPSGGYVVDRALLFALARHESSFDPAAISSRGARGLMQIMPATANYMLAADSQLSAMAEDQKLIDPSFNMTLGQKYVQNLAAQPGIGNNLMLLLAAYNSGPTKTMGWIRGREGVDPLLFLESIPVRETRNYIARVLPHYWAYRVRLGRPTTALRDLAEGHWPKPALSEDQTVRLAQVVGH